MKTPKRKSEDAFRNILAKAMKGHWAMTWHEDREISPGVPDLHYHMNGSDNENGRFEYCVGWLELKSVNEDVTPSNRIGIEPSQHQYIRTWKDRMPIHFLVRIKSHIYLIPAERHSAMALAGSTQAVAELSIRSFPQEVISEFLPKILRDITRI